jgi:hypothetical protein
MNYIACDFQKFNKFDAPTIDSFVQEEDSLIAAAARAQISIIYWSSSNFRESRQLVFPLCIKMGEVMAVIQVIRGAIILAEVFVHHFDIFKKSLQLPELDDLETPAW